MKMIEIRVAGVLIDRGAVLLANHRKGNLNYWVVPGGHVKYGESLESALKREFREEAGIDISVGKLAFINDFIEKDSSRHVLNLYFEVAKVDPAAPLAVKADETLHQMDFFSPDDLASIAILPDIQNEIIRILTGQNLDNNYLGIR